MLGRRIRPSAGRRSGSVCLASASLLSETRRAGSRQAPNAPARARSTDQQSVSGERRSDTQGPGLGSASSNRVKTLGLHDGQKFQRWPARPLVAALPFADKLGLHIKIMREHTLADACAFAVWRRSPWPTTAQPSSGTRYRTHASSPCPSARCGASPRRFHGSRPTIELRCLLFFFAIAHHLSEFRLRQRRRNLQVAVREIVRCERLEVVQFYVVDVVALALGKAIEEHAALRRSKGDDRSVAARATAAPAGNALIDELPPRSASTKPRPARATASQSRWSSRRSVRAKRVKTLVAKTLKHDLAALD